MNLNRRMAAFACAALLSLPTLAQEVRGTRDEAKAMTERAAEHVKKVGHEKAFKDFMEDTATWRAKDMYVFAMNMNGTAMSHINTKIVGKDLSDFQDQNGKFYVKEMAKTAQKGAGWVEYDVTHPKTKKEEPKVTYVMKMSNYDGYVAVGIYR